MVTLQQLKDWLNITADTWDAQLQGLLDRTLDVIQREVDWYFGPPREVTELLHGTGTGFLYLRQPPVAGNPVVVSTRFAFPEEWEALEATDYELDGRRLLHRVVWDAGASNWRVTYHEGFEELPGDVEQLILNLASATWKGRTLNPEMQSERMGDYSYTRADVSKTAGMGVPGWGKFVSHWKRGKI